MIQDMFDPEFYMGVYETVDVGTNARVSDYSGGDAGAGRGVIFSGSLLMTPGFYGGDSVELEEWLPRKTPGNLSSSCVTSCVSRRCTSGSIETWRIVR